MSVITMAFGAVMARLRSVAICFTVFSVLSPNESEGGVGFGSDKITIISLTD